MSPRPLRTWLFAPAADARKIEKALSSTADAVILDLEDAVANSEKPRAREMIRTILAEVSRERRVFVRVNDLSTGMTVEDLRATCTGGLAGIVLTKVESAEMIHQVSAHIDEFSRKQGVPAEQTRMVALLETAGGILHAEEIAGAGGRLDFLMFGAGDFTNDLGIPTSNVGPHILNAKIQTALASRACGLARPIDAVYFDVTDPAGFEVDCRGAKALGFQGKAVIHPNQVEAANTVFSPDTAEIAAASQVVEAFTTAEASGVGAIRVEGKLVDYAMVKNAEKVLATARALDLL